MSCPECGRQLRWRYERKDGGPDLRYKDNRECCRACGWDRRDAEMKRRQAEERERRALWNRREAYLLLIDRAQYATYVCPSCGVPLDLKGQVRFTERCDLCKEAITVRQIEDNERWQGAIVKSIVETHFAAGHVLTSDQVRGLLALQLEQHAVTIATANATRRQAMEAERERREREEIAYAAAMEAADREHRETLARLKKEQWQAIVDWLHVAAPHFLKVCIALAAGLVIGGATRSWILGSLVFGLACGAWPLGEFMLRMARGEEE